MKCSICGGTMEYARAVIQSVSDDEVVGHLCGGCYAKLRRSEKTAEDEG